MFCEELRYYHFQKPGPGQFQTSNDIERRPVTATIRLDPDWATLHYIEGPVAPNVAIADSAVQKTSPLGGVVDAANKAQKGTREYVHKTFDPKQG